MTMQERTIWVNLVVTPATAIVYFSIVLSRASSTPVSEVSWIVPLLWSIGVIITATIVGVILMTIGAAIRSEVTGEGQGDLKQADGDVRDKEIEMRGEHQAQYLTGLGCVAVLILAMYRVDHFWIANAVFLAGTLAGIHGAIAKIVLYRRGF